MEFGIHHDSENKGFFSLASFAIIDCFDNKIANYTGKNLANETRKVILNSQERIVALRVAALGNSTSAITVVIWQDPEAPA
jgi:hypothetical protein